MTIDNKMTRNYKFLNWYVGLHFPDNMFLVLKLGIL